MNLKQAKLLRKKVYGDMSLKVERSYDTVNGGKINTGIRLDYQLEKRRFKQSVRGF